MTAFIDANRDDVVDGRRLGVEPICEVLQVAPSSYYAARDRPPSARSLRDAELTPRLTEIWKDNYQVYGSRKLWKTVRRAGIEIGRDQTHRLMRQAGIQGVLRSKRVRTTRREQGAGRHPDLVGRQFTALAPNQLWVTDLTFVATWAGVAYVCFIVDVFSRMIVGWRVAGHMRTPMVLDAIEMAGWNRGLHHPGLRCHSDGSQPGLNRPSQRLILEGCDGLVEGLGFDGDGAPGDAFAGAPARGVRVDRAVFWLAIGDGMSTAEAAELAGVSEPVGSRWFRQGGGMLTISLAPLSGRYLSFAEREEIALLRVQGHGVREIARRIGRSPSTISRELRRNAATRQGKLEYRASVAQWKAELMARRPKSAKLAADERLREYVQERLAGQIRRPNGVVVPGPVTRPWGGRNKPRRQDRRWARAWSPEQISNRLRLDFPDDESMRISHEAIYQALYVQGRGALKRELVACLRTGRALRIPRARCQQRGKKFVSEEIMISERAAEAEDRAVPGHWEGDLILGTGHSAIGTLVERTTRFTMLLHLPPSENPQPRIKNGPPVTGHGGAQVRDAIAGAITTLPEQLRRSLT